MDAFLDYLNTRLSEYQKSGRVDHFMDLALLLKEGLGYTPDDPRLLTQLARVVGGAGYAWEAWQLARKAHALDGNAEARGIIAAVEEPRLPVEVTLELSTVCNLRCPLCENGAGLMDYPRKFMPYETFERVWKRLKPTTQRLILVGSGETFLHPDIYKILDRVKGVPYVYVDTNGNVDLDFDRIIAAGIDEFTFSVDGINQQMYETYRRNGNLERVLANVRGLVAAKRRKGASKPLISFKFIVFRHTEMYIEEAKRLAGECGADQLRLEPCTFKPMFGREAFDRFMPLGPEHQRIEWVDFARGELGAPRRGDSRHCQVPLWGIMVTAQGEVSPCCNALHQVAFGNLQEQSLEEIWRGKDYSRFRRRVLEDRRSEPVCRTCSREQNNLGMFLNGLGFDERPVYSPPPGPGDGEGVLYVRDMRVTAEEMAELVASGRANEAQYFLSIGKADVPAGWSPGKGPQQTATTRDYFQDW